MIRTLSQMALEQGFHFKVAQHREFRTSFWNVGEIGHSNGRALGFFPKIQLPATEWEIWSGQSFPAPHRMVL